MSGIKQKLQSQGGASFILALLFFFIAITLGGLTLASASANAGRLSHLREEQQAYLTVSSAARLVQEGIARQSFWATETTVAYEDGSTSGPITEYSNRPTGTFDGLVYDWAKYIYQQNNDVREAAMPPSGEFNIESAELGTVCATITMDANYNITILLYLEDAEDRYKMTLTAPAVILPIKHETTDNFAMTVTTTVGVEVSWQNIAIIKGVQSQEGV